MRCTYPARRLRAAPWVGALLMGSRAGGLLFFSSCARATPILRRMGEVREGGPADFGAQRT